MAELRRSGQALDRTVLMFTSDNGFMLGEHRLGPDQQYVYEPAIRVPLLMRGPGIPRGRRSQLVVNADLAPTILDLARARPGLEVDGRSLLPAIRDPGARLRDEVPIMVGPHFDELEFRGVRTQRYAYARYSSGEEELYDLRRDPDQLENVARDPRHRALVATLRERALALSRCRGRGCRTLPGARPGAG